MTTPAQNLAGDSASAALATLPAATLTQSDAADPGSVGLVAPVFLRFDEPLPLLSPDPAVADPDPLEAPVVEFFFLQPPVIASTATRPIESLFIAFGDSTAACRVECR